MDDNDFIGRDRPRFSNPNGVLGWIHEGLTTCCAKNVWTICNLFRSSRCRRKPRLADPENKIGFAYVMNQMEQSLLPAEKSLRLVDAIYDSGD